MTLVLPGGVVCRTLDELLAHGLPPDATAGFERKAGSKWWSCRVVSYDLQRGVYRFPISLADGGTPAEALALALAQVGLGTVGEGA